MAGATCRHDAGALPCQEGERRWPGVSSCVLTAQPLARQVPRAAAGASRSTCQRSQSVVVLPVADRSCAAQDQHVSTDEERPWRLLEGAPRDHGCWQDAWITARVVLPPGTAPGGAPADHPPAHVEMAVFGGRCASRDRTRTGVCTYNCTGYDVFSPLAGADLRPSGTRATVLVAAQLHLYYTINLSYKT